MFKKVCSCLLALVLVVSILSGCGGNGGAGGSTQNSTRDEGASNAQTMVDNSTQVTENNPSGKYDPAITVRLIYASDDSLEKNMQKLGEGETPEDNRYTRLFEANLGIKVKYDWIAKGEAFTQKRKLTILSGDLPDFLPVSLTELKQLYEADQIQDMTDVYKNYAAPLSKEIMESDGTFPFDAATYGGKLMAIPNIWSSYDSARFLWVRYDWLEKLNLPEPKTMEDVLKIAEAFAKDDPDGNGKNDTYGLGIHNGIVGYDGAGGLDGFFNGFGAYPETWYDNGKGELVFGTVQPEMKLPLQKLQEMYKTGIIDKEFVVKDSRKFVQDANAGKIGLAYGGHWLSAAYQSLKNIDPKLDLRPYSILTADGKPLKVQLPMGTGSWWVARKDVKNPEAIMKIINQQLEISVGETADESYTRSPEGVGTWTFSPVYLQVPEINIMSWNAVKQYVEKENLDGVDPISKQIVEQLKAYMVDGDNKMWGMYKIYAPQDSSMEVLDYYIKNNLFLKNQFYGAPTPSMVKRNETLKTLREETFLKIITGEAGIDEFDNFVEQWKKLGGNDIVKEVNEWNRTK